MYPYKKIAEARLLWLTLAALALLLLALFSPRQSAAQSGDSQPLAIGAPIARDLSGGQTHSYQLSLPAAVFVKVEAEQRWVDVVIRLFAPDGKQIAEADSPNGVQGLESVMFISKATGVYRVEVASLDKNAEPGKYEIRLAELRPPLPEDEDRIAAVKAFAEGALLGEQETKAAREAAIRKFNEALSLYRAVGDKREEAETLYCLGYNYQFQYESQTAFGYYEQARQIYQALNDRGEQARMLRILGALSKTLGDMPKALAYYDQCLLLYRAAGDPTGEVGALINTGNLYVDLGEFRKALETSSQALAIARDLGYRNAQYQSLSALSNAHFFLGELQQALEANQQALPLASAAGDEKLIAVVLNNTGFLYRHLGDAPMALNYYLQALPIYRKINDLVGESAALNNIGISYQLQGNLPQALEYFNQALSHARTAKAKEYAGIALGNIGRVQQGLGDLPKATESFTQALALSREIGDHIGESTALMNLGLVSHDQGNVSQSLAYLTQALALAQRVGYRLLEAKILKSIAQTERTAGKLGEARGKIERAISLLEVVRAGAGSRDTQASFFATVADAYDFYTDLLMLMHRVDPQARYDQAALKISEQSRARSLLELLGESRVSIRQGVDLQLLERERSLGAQLTIKLDKLTRLLNGKYSEAQKSAAEKEIQTLTEEYRREQTAIRQASPLYATLTQPQPLSALAIQQLLDDDALLLEYALGEKRSYLWVVAPSSVTSYELAPRGEIEKATRGVYELLAARPQRGASLNPQFIAQATALSRMLLGPAAAQLGKKRLVIVAPSVLSYLPFAALPAPGGKSKTYLPLMAAHEIVNLPSASVLAAIRHETEGRQPASQTLAILADPVFAANDPRVKASGEKPPLLAAQSSALTRSIKAVNSSSTRNGLTRLAFSRQEADAIFAVASRGAGLKATDFTASRATALSQQLSQYRMLHFATHGLLNNENPELSGLVFSLVDETGKTQDGFMRLHEIFNLKLNADLVVLSACQTGLGREIKGEGIIGLTRGFMYAGVPRVVTSLWNVDDLATAELMKLFYQGMLKNGLRPAAALRMAQDELSKQRRWASPYFWAGFVLQGEWK